MRPDEYESLPEHNSRRGGRFELFFYERVGTIYRLRFTRLVLILVLYLTFIPCAAILAIYYQQSRADLDNVNINIRETWPSANYRIIITPAPTTMPPPRVGRSPRGNDPARQTPAAPGLNPLTPSPTPSPAPPRPPN